MRTNSTVISTIRDHARETYPEECCGFLLGVATPQGNVAFAAWEADNARDENRKRRYTITPKDYIAADRAAKANGLDIIGFYHSHPDHPALPSPTDLKQATFPGYTYVIQSVMHGQPADLTAWSLAPDRSRFRSDSVELIEALADSKLLLH